jgi:hypothetical protein
MLFALLFIIDRVGWGGWQNFEVFDSTRLVRLIMLFSVRSVSCVGTTKLVGGGGGLVWCVKIPCNSNNNNNSKNNSNSKNKAIIFIQTKELLLVVS